MFNQINEPEVICLGNGRDLICDYNDNHSSKETPNHRINDIQGQIIEDEQSLEVVKEELKSKNKELDGQINESKKAKKRRIPSFSCYVCQIGQKKGNLYMHLQGKQHAKALNEKKKKELMLEKSRARRQEEKAKKLNEYKQIIEPEVICLVNGKDWDYNIKPCSKDLPHTTVKDIQGQINVDEQSKEDLKKRYRPACDGV